MTDARVLGAIFGDTAPPPESADVHVYLARLEELPRDAGSVARAALAGALADRLGYAFAGGYHAALLRLAPGTGRACLCATEAGVRPFIVRFPYTVMKHFALQPSAGPPKALMGKELRETGPVSRRSRQDGHGLPRLLLIPAGYN